MGERRSPASHGTLTTDHTVHNRYNVLLVLYDRCVWIVCSTVPLYINSSKQKNYRNDNFQGRCWCVMDCRAHKDALRRRTDDPATVALRTPPDAASDVQMARRYESPT